MSIKYTESEIYTINQSMDWKCLYFEQLLDHVETATKTFLGSTSLTGATADAIKCYFSEVHLELILMMKSYIRQIKQKKTIYFDKLTYIDPKVNAIIDTNVLDKCMQDAEAFRSRFNSMIKTFGAIHRDICNLMPVYDEYRYSGGVIANDLLVSTFDHAKNNVGLLKFIVDTVEEQELTTLLPELQETRVAIKNLILELYNKKDTFIKTYSPGDLKKTEGYEAANEAESNSNNYLIKVSAEDSEMRLKQDFGDFQAGKLELAVNLIYSGYGVISSAVSAAKDVGLGIATLTVCPVLGIALIVKGTGEAASAVNNIHATYKYGVAFFTDDIYYEHQSLEGLAQDHITDAFFGGNEALYSGSGTVTNLAITYIETYDKTGSGEFALAYTALDYVNSNVIVPEATEGYVYAINDITGVDISDTVYEEILEDGLGDLTGKPMDMMSDDLSITGDSVTKDVTTGVDKTINDIKETFRVTESEDAQPSNTVNPYIQECINQTEAQAMEDTFGKGYNGLTDEEKVVFYDAEVEAINAQSAQAMDNVFGKGYSDMTYEEQVIFSDTVN